MSSLRLQEFDNAFLKPLFGGRLGDSLTPHLSFRNLHSQVHSSSEGNDSGYQGANPPTIPYSGGGGRGLGDPRAAGGSMAPLQPGSGQAAIQLETQHMPAAHLPKQVLPPRQLPPQSTPLQQLGLLAAAASARRPLTPPQPRPGLQGQQLRGGEGGGGGSQHGDALPILDGDNAPR